MVELWPHQKAALRNLRNGSVLVGGTGSGKSITALAYYDKVRGEKEPPRTLFVITTAKKRDSGDWIREADKLGINDITVDSWNNIKKYRKEKGAFFIFDEQRVIGYGVWTKSFLKITRSNGWILLSATPADRWTDLIPVFIAHRFYRNKTDFMQRHVIFAPYVKYPKIIGYRAEQYLERLRDSIFVVMPSERHTTRHIRRVPVEYNKETVRQIVQDQWDPFKKEPVTNLSAEVHLVRRVVNSHPSRILSLIEIQKVAKRLIIFYNYNYELFIMREWFGTRTLVAELNGYRHDDIPEENEWVYLVQYNSGSEAWECFETNHVAFYSLAYSYRTMEQARGRIDRHNTDFTDLYYYELVSDSAIDQAVLKALSEKKTFNIRSLTREDLSPRQ